jgi:hypothetical protein
MTTEEAIRIHSERAMTELELALMAVSRAAARAHFGLSSLHLDRLRRLQGGRSSEVIGSA